MPRDSWKPIALAALVVATLQGCSSREMAAFNQAVNQPYRSGYSPYVSSSRYGSYSPYSNRYNPYLYGTEYGDAHYRTRNKIRSPNTYLSDVAEGQCCPWGYYRDRVGGCRKIP